MEEVKKKLKRQKKQEYFGEAEELAIKEFLTSDNDQRKNKLFAEVIDPAFRKLVKGILSMPKFQKIIGLTVDFDCEEGAYYHLLFNMHKFNPERIGKSGGFSKAYSYYGTAVKNFVLGLKIQADGHIAKYGGMVDIEGMNEDVKDGKKDIKGFEDLRTQILSLLKAFSDKCRLTKNDIIVLNCLKYMLINWHKLDFHDKNQFNRLLVSYTQLPSNVVMSSLKKIKGLLYQNSDVLNNKKPVSKRIFKNKKEEYYEEDGPIEDTNNG